MSTLVYKDTTPENREIWKSELAQAVRDIQDIYESKLDSLRQEMENQCNIKVPYQKLFIQNFIFAFSIQFRSSFL